MCLFLIFFWCSGFLDDLEARAFFAIDSRFGEFNSRLGRRKFPVRSATGIGSQWIDLLCRFFGQTALMWGKSKKFPVRREKPGNGPSSTTGRGARLPDNTADLGRVAPIERTYPAAPRPRLRAGDLTARCPPPGPSPARRRSGRSTPSWRPPPASAARR
jgi:hypothetical protein